MVVFELDPDTLHDIVNDREQGPGLLQHVGGVRGLAQKLHTSLSRGLPAVEEKEEEEEKATDKKAAKSARGGVSEQRKERVRVYGESVLPSVEEVTFFDHVKEALEDRMVQILIVSAIASLVLGLTVPDQTTGLVDLAHGWIEGAAILLSVALVTLVSSVNNYQKDQKFKQLTQATPPVRVSVIRAGRTVDLTDRDLLVGDLLNISAGDVLTVDGIVLRSSALKVDESAATGENDDISKSERGDSLVRSGSYVVEGEGTMLVTGVGVHSFAGRIAMQVRVAKEETPLQEKLTALADQIGYVGMAAAFTLFTVLSAKEVMEALVWHMHPLYYKRLLDHLTTAVTIVVVAVPEGLPLSVTIALAYSMKQMFREHNLVRHLAACETMGGATTICTDKTGTITQNNMTVTDGVTSYGVRFSVPPVPSSSSAAAESTAKAGAGGRDRGKQIEEPVLSSPVEEGLSSFDAFYGVRLSSPVTSAPTATVRSPHDPFPLVTATTSIGTQQQQKHRKARELLLEGIALNTKATRTRVRATVNGGTASGAGGGDFPTPSPGSSPPGGGVLHMTGSKTEQALLQFAERIGADPMALRAATLARARDVLSGGSPATPAVSAALSGPWPPSTPLTASPSTIGEPPAASLFQKEVRVYPFSSARKRMTTGIVFHSEGIVRYHVKGASELVLEACRYTLNERGQREPLRPATRAAVQESIMALARRRLRTLAFAYAEEPLAHPETNLDGGDDHQHRATKMALSRPSQSGDGDRCFHFPDTDDHLQGLTLIGVVGIRDPVRVEVPQAIARCRRAGVTVRMITGDNKATAVSIAKEVGIYGKVWFGPARGEQGLALEGVQFRAMAKSARKLNAILPRLQVISRASPLDKQILVAELMKRGEVVAVTGDGTNDAPALKNANVGFSMNSGTEVAKNASDVVILDDNFSTIVTAIKWGRNVHDNITKFLQFQMTVNVAAVCVAFTGALLDSAGESPLKPVQLLWLNLIMDTLAALALATESPSDDVLLRPPKPRQAPLLSRRLWVNVLGQAVYQIVLQLWLLHAGYAFFGVPARSEEHMTIVFNVFVLLQLCNEFNARVLDQSLLVLHNLRYAPLFLLVVGSTFLIQVLGVQYGGAIMHAVPLSRGVWWKCLWISSAPLPLGIVLRRITVTEKPIPPTPVVVDATEEAALAAAEKQRARPTLREAARRVVVQLKVVAAFSAAASDDGKKRAAPPQRHW